MKGAADTPGLEQDSPAWLLEQIEAILGSDKPPTDEERAYYAQYAARYNELTQGDNYDINYFNNQKSKSKPIKMATAKKTAPKKAAAKKTAAPKKVAGAAKKAAPKKASKPKAEKAAKEFKNTGAGLGRPAKGDGTVVQQIPFFTTYNDALAFTKKMGFEGVRGGLSKAIKKLHLDHFGKEFGK